MIGRGYLSNEKLLRNLKINSYVLFHSTGRRVKTKEECKLQFSNEERNPPKCNYRHFSPMFDDYDNSSKCADDNPSFTKFVLTDLNTAWDNDAKVYGFELQGDIKYIILWDGDQKKIKYGFPPNDCLTNRTSCKDWAINEEFYCTEQATAAVITWFAIFILPTILFNLTTLVLGLKGKFFKMVLLFPPLLFQGIFGFFLYEPNYNNYLNDGIELRVSVPFSITNGVLCLLQQGMAIFILSHNHGWKFLFKNGKLF